MNLEIPFAYLVHQSILRLITAQLRDSSGRQQQSVLIDRRMLDIA